MKLSDNSLNVVEVYDMNSVGISQLEGYFYYMTVKSDFSTFSNFFAKFI